MIAAQSPEDVLRRSFFREAAPDLLREVGLIGIPAADALLDRFDRRNVFAPRKVRGEFRRSSRIRNLAIDRRVDLRRDQFGALGAPLSAASDPGFPGSVIMDYKCVKRRKKQVGLAPVVPPIVV